MSDPNKPPDFDPDKTMVDVRKPAATPTDDSDRTIGGQPPPASSSPDPRSAPPSAPAEDDGDRTVLIRRPAAAPPPVDDDRTMIAGRGAMPGAAPRAAAPSTGAPVGEPSGFEVVVLSGQARGRRFPIPVGEALIGSNPGCPVSVPGIESIHAKLLQAGDGFSIQNIGSAGSVVLPGGRQIVQAKLEPGQLVKIGEVVLRFVKAGEVFSSEYQDAEFSGSVVTRLLAPENRRTLILGSVAVAVAVVVAWPFLSAPPPVQQPEQQATQGNPNQKQIATLLASGEVLFNEGRLIAPPDQPDAPNAFSKFNEVLALDPGNDKALAWLKRIDQERDKGRKAREEEERRRVEAERQRREQARRELEEKVNSTIAQGDALFEKGQVTEPVGQNALARYREALKIDPESTTAQQRVQKAVQHFIEQGDDLREKGDLWSALENYRKASRATDGKVEDVEKRIQEVVANLKSGFTGTGTHLILYKDDRGKLFVLDEMEKVPARYRDRAVEIMPDEGKKPAP